MEPSNPNIPPVVPAEVAMLPWSGESELAFPADPLTDPGTTSNEVVPATEEGEDTTLIDTTAPAEAVQEQHSTEYEYPRARKIGALGHLGLRHEAKVVAVTHNQTVSGNKDAFGSTYRDAEPLLVKARVSGGVRGLNRQAKKLNRQVRDYVEQGLPVPEELATQVAAHEGKRQALSPAEQIRSMVEGQKVPLKLQAREAMLRSQARHAEQFTEGGIEAIGAVPEHLLARAQNAHKLREHSFESATPPANLGEVLQEEPTRGFLRMVYANLPLSFEGARKRAVRAGQAIPDNDTVLNEMIRKYAKTAKSMTGGKLDLTDPGTFATIKQALLLPIEQFDATFPAPVRRQRTMGGPRRDDAGGNRDPRTPTPTPTGPEYRPVTPEPVTEVAPEPTPEPTLETNPIPLEPSVEVPLDPTSQSEVEPVEAEVNPEPVVSTPVTSEAIRDNTEEPDTEFNERELLNLGRVRGLKQRIEKQVSTRLAEAQQAALTQKQGFDKLAYLTTITGEVQNKLLADYLDIEVEDIPRLPVSLMDKLQDLLDMPWEQYNQLGGGPKPKDGPKPAPRPASRPQTPPRQSVPRQDRSNKGKDRSIEQQYGSWRDEIPGM